MKLKKKKINGRLIIISCKVSIPSQVALQKIISFKLEYSESIVKLYKPNGVFFNVVPYKYLLLVLNLSGNY